MMAKAPKRTATIVRSFYLADVQAQVGGFPAAMNQHMNIMRESMLLEGIEGPYDWRFEGGDGVVSPVMFRCSKI